MPLRRLPVGRVPALACLAGLAALATACAGEESAPQAGAEPAAQVQGPVPGVPSKPPPPGQREGISARSVYRIRYATSPDPIPLNALFEVRTTVVDARTGEPLTEGEVKVDARMPDHGHGMETAPVTEPVPGEPGVYLTRGMKFHMPGSWTITVDVGGERPDRIEFVHVAE